MVARHTVANSEGCTTPNGLLIPINSKQIEINLYSVSFIAVVWICSDSSIELLIAFKNRGYSQHKRTLHDRYHWRPSAINESFHCSMT